MNILLIIIGACPQFIKAAMVSRELGAKQGYKEILVHTVPDLVTSKISISKIPRKYSCFRQKTAISEHNWTLSISGLTVISDNYPIDRSMERYLRRISVHFFALKMG